MQLCIRTIDAMSVYVTAYVEPVICSPVSNQEIQSAVECYPYLQGLQLACGDVSGTVSVDPLGLICPVTLPFKILFQKLCKAQRDWDELVDTELNQE